MALWQDMRENNYIYLLPVLLKIAVKSTVSATSENCIKSRLLILFVALLLKKSI